MNIIEAMQAAENGALITNGFLKQFNYFLKYIKAGTFYQYEIVNGKHQFQYHVRDFNLAAILSTSWEIVPDTFFQK